MFRKQFRVKSNSQTKASERKNFKDKLTKTFPNLTEADLETLLPKKENLNFIKLVTANNEIVYVYTIQKYPIIFELETKIFPTIYLLWKFPNLIPTFTTHPQVLQFLNSGADLMLPGVVTPQSPNKYGNLQTGAIASVSLSTNKAPIAVGVTAQSSYEMLSGKGKCLVIYHVIGDKLFTFDGLSLPVPQLGPPEWLRLTSYDTDFPELGAESKPAEEVLNSSESKIENLEITSEEDTDMDELLHYCFFVAIKYSKTLTLPVLTSNFYKSQMIPQCPEGQVLDLKKSSFKKLKPFLDKMCKDGIITVKEVKKGVESITDINKDHPKITEFYVEPQLRPKKSDDSSVQPSTSITESYVITQNVLPIFTDANLNKGDVIQPPEIRKYVTEYVKKHECQDENNRRLVKPKEALIKICKTENPISWEELIEKVCESMKSCYKVSSGSEQITNKGKLSPITLTVSVRSGNKKVTLVDNLELYNIKIQEFAKECQHGIAASTSINKIIGKKSDQLLIQGNQVIFVYNLLTEKYKIPQKYIRGLENAPKKKK